MAKYKRADFGEEEDSVNVVNSNDRDGITGILGDHHSKIHVHPIQPLGIWSSRSLLEKILVGLTFGLLFLVVIAFTLLAKRNDSWNVLHFDTEYPHGSSDNLCLTPKCVQIASTMLASMDLNAKPCEDFYQVEISFKCL